MLIINSPFLYIFKIIIYKKSIFIKVKLTNRLKERSETHSCPPIRDQLIKFIHPTKFHLNWLQSILDHFLTQKNDLNPPRGRKNRKIPKVAHQISISKSRSKNPPIFIKFGDHFNLNHFLTQKIDLKPTQRSKEASGTHSCPPILDQQVNIYKPTKFHWNWLQSIFELFLNPKIHLKPFQRSKKESCTHSCPPTLDQHDKIYTPTNFYLIWRTFYFRPFFDPKNRL